MNEDVVSLQMRHLGIVVGITLGLGIIGFVILGNTGVGQEMSFVYPVVLIGSVGGTANAARRVQKLAQEPESVQAAVPPRLAVAQTWLSPIIGGTFAAVLYTLFVAGMLQGEFFPAFACAGDAFTDYRTFATCNPATNADAAMALVWGFAAGFAERLVPNVLDRFLASDESVREPPRTAGQKVDAAAPHAAAPHGAASQGAVPRQVPPDSRSVRVTRRPES